MNRLEAELQRLYPAPAANGQVRAMVLELARPASWELLAKVWQGVQLDLELPAPAIAVSGGDAYQLWFSLAEPMPSGQALAFLESLRSRYLGDVVQERVRMRLADAVTPPFESAPGRWSAFVTQDLAGLFSDEPWLDLPPSPEAQADVLSRLQSIKRDDLERAMETPLAAAAPALHNRSADTKSAPAADRLDPKAFLLEVMNDTAVELQLRIEAAKALLPYFEGGRP